MDKVITINATCPVCHTKHLRVLELGYETYKCTSCGEVLVIENMLPKGEPKEIDGRHVI